MRKTFSALATLLFIFASCEKNPLPQVQEPQNIKIDFSVSAPSADTRSVKKDWAAGDKINIWFDENIDATPQLVLTYNGSTWTPSELSATTVAALSSEGEVHYFYEGYNDLSKYTTYTISPARYFEAKKVPLNGTYCYYSTFYFCSHEDVNYSFDGSTLRAILNKWVCENGLEVFVRGISNPGNYALKANSSLGLAAGPSLYPTSADVDGGIGGGSFFTAYYIKGLDYDVGGASFFVNASYIAASETVVFELYDIAASSTKTYTITGKYLPYSPYLRRVILDISDFS